ncbi:type II toxin-antitoxin system VapC family toxin [Saccharothrix deserti]|uniref:type II toxin-antitoxin system VapC family toxin n=1 Tax=Saccharothrix deserti TaxID=2593674 RepID=UPI00131D5E88|nr:type II toxin-antitoxin system VapC family toxin [Saccharothrix deserti]
MSFTAVVDNSALIEFLVNPKPNTKLAQRMLTGTIAAPELIDAEAFKVLRHLHLNGTLTAEQAQTVMQNVQEAPITRFTHRAVVERAWAIRHSLSAFDSFYVALAEQLGVPLITCDKRMAGSNGHQAHFEVYPVS